ncbi:hypothetical protein B0H10DRAFT_2234222 [Mycena sp. CBHHK59/15]|nr:hypothetical protein B0H10DRAFT_2234222 [Mycena sp. CBHHK59/15]
MPLKHKHILSRITNLAKGAKGVIEWLSPSKKKRKTYDEREKENTVPKQSTSPSDISDGAVAFDSDNVFFTSQLSDSPSNGAFSSHTGYFLHTLSPTIPTEASKGHFDCFHLPPPRPLRLEEVPDQDDILVLTGHKGHYAESMSGDESEGDESEDESDDNFDVDIPQPPTENAPGPSVTSDVSNGCVFDADVELEGKLCEAPVVSLAVLALNDLKLLLCPKWPSGKGYIDPQIDPFVRVRMEAMQSLLNLYTHESSKTKGQWRASSIQAAITQNKGPYWTCQTRLLVQQFIWDRTILPLNPYGYWRTSMLSDEELHSEISLHLQQFGKDITAQRLVDFLAHNDVMQHRGNHKEDLVPNSTVLPPSAWLSMDRG